MRVCLQFVTKKLKKFCSLFSALIFIVLNSIPKPVTTASSSSPLAFLHIIERLKTTPREGWRRFDIQHGESIADHMYRMSIITMLCPPEENIDKDRCVKLALIHDMAEALVGDITPPDRVPKGMQYSLT